MARKPTANDDGIELPTIKRIVHETDAAYAIFENGAAIGYRKISAEELPQMYEKDAVEEVTYLPGDFLDTVYDSAHISVAPDRVHECLVETLDEYEYYLRKNGVEELRNDWTAIAEVLCR